MTDFPSTPSDGPTPEGSGPPAGWPPPASPGAPSEPPFSSGATPPTGSGPAFGSAPTGPAGPTGQPGFGGSEPPFGGAQPSFGDQPAFGQPSMGSPGGMQSVGPWPRLGARIIDWLVLLIPSFIVGLIFGGGALLLGGNSDANLFLVLIGSLVGTAISFGYYVLMETSRGQTVGKMALSMKVVGPNGGNPTVEESIKRNIFYAFGLLGWIPILGFLSGLVQIVAFIALGVTINSDPFNRGWHDNFAGGTAVIKS